jgi:4-hydroxy-tetrahydrodipicolinate reductase
MNIGIIGYGAMGKMIECIAKEKGIKIVSTIDPLSKDAKFKEINKESLKDVDIVIDFSHPEAALANIKKYCELKVNVVLGTTGWYDKLDEVKNMVKEAGIGFLWSSNYSVGVNMYFKMIEAAAKLMEKIEDYDLWAFELHHHNKKDSPSGTAKTLSKILLDNISRKKKAVYNKLDRKIEKDEFHFASVRGGPVNFEHTIGFDSEADCITIKHAARNRQGYALGAVLAAIWLHDKKGYFEMDDFLEELIGGK